MAEPVHGVRTPLQALLRIGVAVGAPLALVAGAILLYLVDPIRSRILPFCPTYLLTGFYCTGCGTTRMLHSLLHLRILEAIDHNPLMFFLVPVVGYFGLASYLRFLAARPILPELRISRWVAVSILIAALVFTVFRNLPCAPFTYLAP